MTAGLVVDTHALVWYLFRPEKLSARADSAISSRPAAGMSICASVMSLIEVRYLVENGRLPPEEYENLVLAFHDPLIPLELFSIDRDIALAVERIPRDVVPDLPDRIIAATALTHNLPLVTADHRIRAASIPTIW